MPLSAPGSGFRSRAAPERQAVAWRDNRRSPHPAPSARPSPSQGRVGTVFPMRRSGKPPVSSSALSRRSILLGCNFTGPVVMLMRHGMDRQVKPGESGWRGRTSFGSGFRVRASPASERQGGEAAAWRPGFRYEATRNDRDSAGPGPIVRARGRAYFSPRARGRRGRRAPCRNRVGREGASCHSRAAVRPRTACRRPGGWCDRPDLPLRIHRRPAPSGWR